MPCKLPLMVPLPFVGEEETEYVALVAAPNVGPLGAPISSVPERLPIGLAPSAMNSPEKITARRDVGVVVEPAYLPITEGLSSETGACGSPKPNETAPSGTMRKALLELTK